MLAHIGNIPVEEWLPFLVPVIALYLFGRRNDRRRRDAAGELPAAGEPLDDGLMEHIEAQWSKAHQDGISREHLPLLLPPGPDGRDAGELATRAHIDAAEAARLLEQLEQLGYVEFDEIAGTDGRCAWLTFSGHALVDLTEHALLSGLAETARASD